MLVRRETLLIWWRNFRFSALLNMRVSDVLRGQGSQKGKRADRSEVAGPTVIIVFIKAGNTSVGRITISRDVALYSLLPLDN